MTIDLRSIPTQVLINNGTNDLDVSQAFVSLSLASGVWDESGWFKMRGTLTLGAYVAGFSESFDCRLNPSRWAPGNTVAIALWFGSWVPLPWRLRILRYPNRPWPGKTSLDIEVGSDGDLLNYRAPEGDPSGVEYGTSTSVGFLINAALSKAGAPALADPITSLALPFSPGKTNGGSWITYAGQAAYAAGHILWQQADGAVRAVPLTTTGLVPFAGYVVGRDAADYIPETGQESPPEKVKVTGTTYDITTVGDETNITTDTIDGVTVRTTTIYRDRDTETPEYSERVEQPANVVLPNLFSTGELITESLLEKDWTYGAGSRLTTEVETINKPVALVFPNEVWGNPTQLTIETRQTIAYTYDADDIIIERRTTLEVAVLSGITATTTTSQVTIEKWDSVGSEEYIYSRSQVNYDPTVRALPQRRTTGTNARPPQTQYRPAEKQREEKQVQGTASFTSVAGNGYAEKLQVINLSSGFGVSNQQCRDLAQLWGSIRQGRQFAVTWAADITPGWLQNFSPVRRVDVTVPEAGTHYDATVIYDAGAVVYYQGLSYRALSTTTGNLPTNPTLWEPANVRTAYLIEALNLEIDARSAAIGGRGIDIGVVSNNEALPAPIDPGDPQPVLPEPEPAFVVDTQGTIQLQLQRLRLMVEVAPETVMTIALRLQKVRLAVAAEVQTSLVARLQLQRLRLAASVEVPTAVSANLLLQRLRLAISAQGSGVASIALRMQPLRLAVAINYPDPILTNLLAWYEMDEASGNAIDAHTGGYTLTENGIVGSTAGKVGNARTFDGSDGNYLESSNAIFTRGDTDFYMACWVYFNGFGVSGANFAGRYIFGSNNRSYVMSATSTGLPRFVVSGDGINAVLVDHPTAMVTGTWYFMEVIHNAATNQIGVALNGSAFTNVAHSSGLFGGIATFTVGRVNLGFSSGDTALNGRIDNLILMSAIPDAAERARIYNGGNGIGYPG